MANLNYTRKRALLRATEIETCKLEALGFIVDRRRYPDIDLLLDVRLAAPDVRVVLGVRRDQVRLQRRRRALLCFRTNCGIAPAAMRDAADCSRSRGWQLKGRIRRGRADPHA